MNRRNLIIGSVVAAMLTLPLSTSSITIAMRSDSDGFSDG